MGRSVLRFLVVLLLTVSLGVPATAQVPEQEGPIELEAPGEIQMVSSREPLTFTVTVTHTGPSSGTPVDPSGEGDVLVTITGVPEGWTATAEPSGFPLAPGASRDVTVTVTAGPDTATSADLTILARYTSPDPSKAFLPDGEDSSGVSVERDETLTTSLLETLGTGVWILIGVAVVALLVSGFLLVDSRRRHIRLDCAVSEVNIRPGSVATIPFVVRHRGGRRDRVAVHADMGARGWKADIPAPDVELEAGEAEELLLSVAAPKDAAKGSRQVVRVLAVAESKPDRSAVLSLAVRVE